MSKNSTNTHHSPFARERPLKKNTGAPTARAVHNSTGRVVGSGAVKLPLLTLESKSTVRPLCRYSRNDGSHTTAVASSESTTASAVKRSPLPRRARGTAKNANTPPARSIHKSTIAPS